MTTLSTGLRSGELRAVRWQDIDLNLRALSGDATLAKIEGRWHHVPPKLSAGRRVVPLPDRVVPLPRAPSPSGGGAQPRRLYMDRQPVEPRFRSKWGPHSTARTWFMRTTASSGARACPASGSRIRGTASRLSGCPRGSPPASSPDMLGHSHVSLILNVYSHVVPTVRREAADRRDAMFGTTASPAPSSRPAPSRPAVQPDGLPMLLVN